MEFVCSFKLPTRVGRRLLTSVALCLSTISMSCNRIRGSGRYLITVLGNSPGSDAAYIYDAPHGSLSRLCGDGDNDHMRCFTVATDERVRIVTASILPEAEISDPSELNLRVKFQGHESLVKSPVKGKCSILDISVSPKGAVVLATLFSQDLHASSIWRLFPETLDWKQLSEWEKSPNWVTRPVAIDETDRILYLRVEREARGLISHLQRLSLSTGRSEQLLSDRQIASFAIGRQHQIVLWSQFGLEVMDEKFNSSLIVPSTFLSTTDSIQPGSLAWNMRQDKIALLVGDRKTNVVRLYEFDPITKGSSLIFKKKLGSQFSIQQLY